jgi:hypothetical protein
MNKGQGYFVISLDFELFWGVRDTRTIAEYGKNLIGVHKVIPRLLTLFDNFGVKATFATVGILFLKDKKQLKESLPTRIPHYTNPGLSPYDGYIDSIADDQTDSLYHFAPSLIREIHERGNHEIGSHTFSHYYCLEDGQTVEDFKADLEAANKAAAADVISLTSIVFPRNQFNDEYMQACVEMGFLCYRGNEQHWIYAPRPRDGESAVRRALRLIDSYIKISGWHCYSAQFMKQSSPVNIPSSRFLRPYSRRFARLDPLRLRRITHEMTYAAKKGLAYHLWWHPHNFGVHQEENLAFLESIMAHYSQLHAKYNFESITMTGLATRLLRNE